jgi:hypothetical protein
MSISVSSENNQKIPRHAALESADRPDGRGFSEGRKGLSVSSHRPFVEVCSDTMI